MRHHPPIRPTRRKGVATPTKDELCRLVGCPSATPLDDPSSESARKAKCARCTGPIRWTDADGKRHGLHRACTSCPMNGLGLPVCWCGCDGPNPDFTTDGQRMVTTGGVGDSTGFVEQQMDDLADADRENRDVDRMVDEIDGTGDMRNDGNGNGQMARDFVTRLLATDGAAFDEFAEAFRTGDLRNAARTLGVPFSAFRTDTSSGTVIARAVCGMSGDQWRIVRRIVGGDSQTRVGAIHGDGKRVGISKQAVNKRLAKIVEEHAWLRQVCGVSAGTVHDPAHPHAREVSRHYIKENGSLSRQKGRNEK